MRSDEVRFLSFRFTSATKVLSVVIWIDYYKEAFLNLERMKAAGFRPDEVPLPLLTFSQPAALILSYEEIQGHLRDIAACKRQEC